MFRRILIANRGEIALRIIRACRELGIEPVCVFSEEDRGSAYLAHAERAICIGGPAPRDSYLKSDRIIAAAEVVGADAVHPGYGFLAENPQFAEKCRACNLEFIGPSAEAMHLLGNKAAARAAAARAKVPTVPGSEGIIEDEHDALRLAERLGFPVMIKAAAGGGGRGMRIVRDRKAFSPALRQAAEEARAAFGDPSLYVEKYVEQPRHVEVQILADRHGNVIHFGERDCTIQRRYQKLIEESPSPGIDARTRRDLCAAAVRLAKQASYTCAGTFEFLVDAKGRYYFMEVNARIQVEHPVTEMVTGIDLIRAQIRAAAGEPLGISQKTLVHRGHALECRINAEDPANNFRPCPGRIERFRPPGGFGVRVDTHAHDGYRISPCYDSLIAKLIVHQATRDEALACMRRCLREFVIEPIKTTAPFLCDVINHPDFIAGTVDTGFLERTLLG
ncbi:MAG TPA: acetyl-CoA carboxylase biotin carboxylase subunit [Phycisphaerae bacterium]|nr:acetyl-CoA carboxylase biotin carboxylase subunit [Phycisphaerae bacterium]HNU43845.1 acetyl-CoA carboxylase biotin carboxylase subunit [Phycisphaerae bacterium]